MLTESKKLMLILSMLFGFALASCGGPADVEVAAPITEEEPTKEATNEPTATALPPTNTPEPTATPTEEPTNTPTAEPTDTPEPTATPIPTLVPLETSDAQSKLIEIAQFYSLAIWAHTGGDDVTESLAKLEEPANALGYELPDLQSVPADDAEAIFNHREAALESISSFAKENYGNRSGGLVNIAFNLIRILTEYSEEETDTEVIERMYNNIAAGAAGAKLPADMVVPLLDSLTGRKTELEVTEEVLKLYDEMLRYTLAGDASDPDGGEDYQGISDYLIYLMLIEHFTHATVAHLFDLSESFVADEYEQYLLRANYFEIDVPDLYESVEAGDVSAGGSYMRANGFELIPEYVDEWYGRQGVEIAKYYAQVSAFQFFYEPGVPELNDQFLAGITESATAAQLPNKFVPTISDLVEAEASKTVLVSELEYLKLELRTWILMGAPGASSAAEDGTVYSDNSQLAFWDFGRSLGVASIGRAIDADPAIVERFVMEYEALAELLGITVPPFDEETDGASYDSAISFLVSTEFAISDEIRERFGKEAAGIFRVGFYAELSQLMYDPTDTEQTEAFVGILVRASSDVSQDFYEEIVFPAVSPMFDGADKETVDEQLQILLDTVDVMLNEEAHL